MVFLYFPLRMSTRVFVGGLTYRVRERDLEKFFRKYGRIKEVAMKNGFAFVVSLMWINCFFYSMVGTRVYVGGLPYGTRERDLERFFRGYGRFRDVLIKNGYGFVVSIRTQSKENFAFRFAPLDRNSKITIGSKVINIFFHNKSSRFS